MIWSRCGPGRPRGRRAAGSPRRLPTRNSNRSTGAGPGRTTGSSASTARSGGGSSTFPDGNSTLMLLTARLKYVAEYEWGKRRNLDMSKPKEMDELKGKTEG